TEARNRAVHEPRMLRPERCVIEPDPLERSGPEIFDEHIRRCDEPLENCAALVAFEIERDAFLVPVDAQEVRALASGTGASLGRLVPDGVQKRRTPGACVIALVGLFDFDDTRAHIREKHRAVWPGEHASQVENGDTVKRRHVVDSIMSEEITVYAGSA